MNDDIDRIRRDLDALETERQIRHLTHRARPARTPLQKQLTARPVSDRQRTAYRQLSEFQKTICAVLRTSYGARSISQIAGELRGMGLPKERRQHTDIRTALDVLIEFGLVETARWPTQTAYRFKQDEVHSA